MPLHAAGVSPFSTSRTRSNRPTRLTRLVVWVGAALLSAACAAPPQPVAAPTGRPQPQTAAPGVRVDTSRPVPVALLLPLSSGRSGDQAVARDMEDAARLAAETWSGTARLQLEVADTGGSASGAAAAAERAIGAGAAAIVGPVFAEEASSVAPVAARTGTPVLSLSSFAAAAQPPVYILGFTPEDEVERILRYAAGQGLQRIALVHPQNGYGEVARAAVMAQAPRFGQQIVSVTSYPYNFRGVQDAVGDAAPRIAALQPDAVLVADEQDPLVSVLSFLALGDVRAERTRLLGLKRWEEGRALRNPELRGGWFPALDPTARADFEARFQARHGRAPLPQAVIAYDAVAAVAQLVGSAARTGDATPFTTAAITAPSGFEGGSGRFRLNPNGTITRALAVMEVGAGGPVLRAPAEVPGS